MKLQAKHKVVLFGLLKVKESVGCGSQPFSDKYFPKFPPDILQEASEMLSLLH
jgi:hypothetical protein